MASRLVECVPNISEGRDLEKIEAIVSAARSVSGCFVLGVEPDHDYHRTVITLAGEPEPVRDGAIALIIRSIELLDMRHHQGEHPRLGVVDVCPFVPLKGITMDECAELAREVVNIVASQTNAPLFLYGEAATHPDRTLLSTLRKAEYEGLEARLSNKETAHEESTRLPDSGTTSWNEISAKSGGITVGARTILVAYNVNVDEKDGGVAKKMGSLLRSSGRLIKEENGSRMRIPGMLPMVQGMGVTLEEMGISQVSMNLRDVHQCPLHMAFKACESIAKDHATNLLGSEIVGLVPLEAMKVAGKYFSPNADRDEDLVNAAIDGLGLRERHEFDPHSGIIEWAILKEVNQ
ncbi:MAG: glutamate formimidoyltransferase [Candidatus Poseidonia sp.]|nr:glutamate formimidoyltransferase [Poseidonia sp.]